MLRGTKKSVNWVSLFNTLLGKYDAPYELSVNEDTIVLRGNNTHLAKIQDVLEKVLATPDAFHASLPYEAGHKQQEQKDVAPSKMLRPENTVKAGLEVLSSLYSRESLKKSMVNLDYLFDEEDGAKVVDGVMFSAPIDDADISASMNGAITFFLRHFNHADIQTIRRAWLENDVHLPMPPKNLNEKSTGYHIAEGLAQQCFSLHRIEEPLEDRILFNFGRLYELVMAPEIKFNDEQTELHISREHLISYLLQLIQNGVLFRMYHSPEDAAEIHARPIFLGRSDTVLRPTEHVLVIDRSGSMSNYLDDLKKHVIDFLKEIQKIDPTAKIRIIFFDNEFGPSYENDISKLNSLIDFINKQPLGNTTELFKTMRQLLTEIINSRATEERNISITFFSDGHDNDRAKTNAEIHSEISDFDKNKLAIPKIFTVGFGEVDAKVLSNLAMAMGNPYIQLGDISDFEKILVHLDEMKADRTFIDFVQTLEEQSQQWKIPVYANNAPTVPSIILPMSGNKPLIVRVNGDELIVSIRDQSLIPEAQILDRLEEIAIRVRAVLQGSESITVKNQAIKDAKTAVFILSNNALAQHERSLIQSFERELDLLEKDVQRSQTDHRFAHSLDSYLHSNQGFLTSTITPTQTNPASGDALETSSGLNFT